MSTAKVVVERKRLPPAEKVPTLDEMLGVLRARHLNDAFVRDEVEQEEADGQSRISINEALHRLQNDPHAREVVLRSIGERRAALEVVMEFARRELLAHSCDQMSLEDNTLFVRAIGNILENAGYCLALMTKQEEATKAGVKVGLLG